MTDSTPTAQDPMAAARARVQERIAAAGGIDAWRAQAAAAAAEARARAEEETARLRAANAARAADRTHQGRLLAAAATAQLWAVADQDGTFSGAYNTPEGARGRAESLRRDGTGARVTRPGCGHGWNDRLTAADAPCTSCSRARSIASLADATQRDRAAATAGLTREVQALLAQQAPAPAVQVTPAEVDAVRPLHADRPARRGPATAPSREDVRARLRAGHVDAAALAVSGLTPPAPAPHTGSPRVVAAQPDRSPLPLRLRKVESGLYDTPDGRYGVVRLDSVGEWDTVRTEGWGIADGGAQDGELRPTTYRTMREAVEALDAELPADSPARGRRACTTCGGTGWVRPDGTAYRSALGAAAARRRAVSAAAQARRCPACTGWQGGTTI